MREYLVFTGRPNAGKSSIIKATLGVDVSTGKRPGTTRHISEYPMSRGLFLVDMPGYGRILKASKATEERVKDRIIDFLENNADRIALAVHVLDTSTFIEVTRRLERKGFRSLDLEMIQLLADTLGESPLVVANKIDKAGNRLEDNIAELRNRVAEQNLPACNKCIFPVSAKTGEGLGALKNEIHKRLVNKEHRIPFDFLKD